MTGPRWSVGSAVVDRVVVPHDQPVAHHLLIAFRVGPPDVLVARSLAAAGPEDVNLLVHFPGQGFEVGVVFVRSPYLSHARIVRRTEDQLRLWVFFARRDRRDD